MRSSFLPLCAALLPSGLQALTGPALEANFDQGSPWSLTASDDTLIRVGDAVASEGMLSLGNAGLSVVEQYRQPQGPFSIEARFKLSSYAPVSTRWISDLVNTATWTSSTSQGFTMRVGGGELYPVLPNTAYETAQGIGETYRTVDRTTSASLSRCIGEFNISSGGLYWKEVYTDVCVDLGRWIHMVAVYDGSDMRVFLDGKDATDGWRVQAQSAKPVLSQIAQLHLGARTEESYDSRHSNGRIDFVRIHDSALSTSAIRARFSTLSKDDSRSRCGRMPVIVSPAPGKTCDRDARVKVKLVPTPGCVDSEVSTPWKKGDVVRVRVKKGWSDSSPIEFPMTDSVGTFGGLLPDGQIVPAGEALISVALDSLEPAVPYAARASAATLEFFEATPVVFGATTSARPLAGRATLATRWVDGQLVVGGSARPTVSTIDGSSVAWTVGQTRSGWTLTPETSPRGVHLVRSESGSAIIVVP